MSRTLCLVVEDETTYNALSRVGDELAGDYDVEYLFVDDLYAPDSGKRVSAATKAAHDHREFGTYVRVPTALTTRFPETLPRALGQRLLLDHLATDVFYDLDGLLDDLAPATLLSGMDSIPFVRHLFRAAADRADVATATLQHGLYPKNLDYGWLETRHGMLSPDFSPRWPAAEALKRRLGYPFGVTVYCNPYVDRVFALGSFFADRVESLRAPPSPPGRTSVVATGSPEFDGGYRPYQPATDSVLFLSQQQYESGHWGVTELAWLLDRLEALDEHVPVTVRPHPKDSPEKVQRFADRVAVSDVAALSADVREHDVIVTTHSTAVLEGVVQGKVTGVLEVPFEDGVTHQEFPALEHDHLLRFGREPLDLDAAAARRSEQTQADYLRKFCHVPAATGASGTSVELVVRELDWLSGRETRVP